MQVRMRRVTLSGLRPLKKVGGIMAKLRLFVRVRKQVSRVESVPLKRLLELSDFRKLRWEFVDGWLILEAF